VLLLFGYALSRVVCEFASPSLWGGKDLLWRSSNTKAHGSLSSYGPSRLHLVGRVRDP